MSSEPCAVASAMFDGKLPHCKALIEVDSDARGTVHGCVSAVPEFFIENCAENVMPPEKNSKHVEDMA